MIQNIEDRQISQNSNAPSSFGGKLSRRYGSRLMVQSQNVSTSLAMSDPVPQSSKQCRICLQNQQSDDNELICPCECIGSVKYVHDKCYRKWIEKQIHVKNQKQRQQMIHEGIQCELCKHRINLNFRNQRQCMKWDRFFVRFNQNKTAFFLIIFLLIINFASLGYISYYCATNNINMITLIVITCAYIFLVITAGIGTFYLINDFVIETVLIFDSFLKNRIKNREVNTRRRQISPELSMQQIQ